MAVEDIVPQHERGGIAAHEVRADMIGLGQPLGFGLHGIGQGHAPFAAVAQKSLKGCRVMGRSDDQDVANARQHQGRQRIIDHRLVIDRHQLFRDAFGQRIESCAGPAGQYNSLAHIKLPQRRSRCKVGGCRLQGDVAARNVWLCDGVGPERDSASGRQKVAAARGRGIAALPRSRLAVTSAVA